MLDPKEVLESRSVLRKSGLFYFSHNGKTVKDGIPVSFVLTPEEWRRAKHVVTTNSAVWKAPDEGIPTEKLPPAQRRLSLSYGLDEVFGDGPEGTQQEIKSFYDLTTWDGYVKLVSSELGKRIKRPNTNTMYRGRNK